jgi:predicted neuraminidase
VLGVNSQGAGPLLALFRSRKADWVYAALSWDDGLKWTKPARTSLPNNNSALQVTKVQV